MFNKPSIDNIVILHGQYSIPIVILSVLIAISASYTAISLNQRVQQTSFFHRNFWLILASLAMGFGIWSMHFIGMSAFMMPVSMEFNVLLTAASMVPAVLASFLAFYISSRAYASQWLYAWAGISMGLGIAMMHYVGMAAMEMDAEFYYKPSIFSLSILIAVVVSYIALFVLSYLQRFMGNRLIKLMTAVIMGIGITSMHYTGINAVVFYVEGNIHANMHTMHGMNMSFLITVVTMGISFLLLLSGLANLLDRYVDHRLHYFDSLTLLPNERQFEQNTFYQTPMQGSLAILHLHNLDGWVNDYGYLMGDEIIKSVKSIIQSKLPPSVKVYRIEGNRFAIHALEDISRSKLKVILGSILALLKRPLAVATHSVAVDSVCAMSYSDGSETMKDLFAHTMAVLQHPTTKYNHQIVEYDPSVHTYSMERQLVHDIDRAIRENELFLVYQPKIDSKTWELTGLEALIRWRHPVHGMISPGIFIPILEEYNRIFDVTDWVIKEACRQISKWREEGAPFTEVSINIPGPYVTAPRLLEVIRSNLNLYKVDPRRLELEITETSVIRDIDRAIKAVNEFKYLGLSVALDDFGTGLSSLSYLKKIPITTVKIDKSFVDQVPASEKDSDVLKAIITLCHSLHLKIVIEGVETQEQIDFITSVTEHPQIQGYYFSRPLNEEELLRWYNDHRVALKH